MSIDTTHMFSSVQRGSMTTHENTGRLVQQTTVNMVKSLKLEPCVEDGINIFLRTFFSTSDFNQAFELLSDPKRCVTALTNIISNSCSGTLELSIFRNTTVPFISIIKKESFTLPWNRHFLESTPSQDDVISACQKTGLYQELYDLTMKHDVLNGVHVLGAIALTVGALFVCKKLYNIYQRTMQIA